MSHNKSDFKTVLNKVGLPTTLLKKRNKYFKKKEFNEDEPSEQETQYRNRALERTQLKEEYKKINEEYELFQRQSEHDSKYMGGDEEFTHLVKGLDYKLLEKVKSKLKSNDQGNISNNETKEELGIGFTELGFDLYKNFFYYLNVNNVNYMKKLEKMISAVYNGYKLKNNNRLSNTNYNYDLSNSNNLPSIIINNNIESNSSSNNNKEKDTKLLNMYNNTKIKNELISIFNWHLENRKKKKGERLPLRPSNLEEGGIKDNNDEESDDDIYTNVGSSISHDVDNLTLNTNTGNDNYFNNELINEEGMKEDKDNKDNNKDRGYSMGSNSNNKVAEDNKVESRMESKLTYKIPEKLLKRNIDIESRLNEKLKNKYNDEEDIDYYYDSDEDYSGGKRVKKSKKMNKKELEEIMNNSNNKDNRRSLDQIESNINKGKNINKNINII